MQRYIGTKIIEAEQAQASKNIGDYIKGSDGYDVYYPDGYISWSPKAVFEEAYRKTEELPFGLAIEALKKGFKVCRTVWNGKGMFLYYVPENSYPTQTQVAKETFGKLVPYSAYIAMKTAQNNVVPWIASQTDVLADDWLVIT